MARNGVSSRVVSAALILGAASLGSRFMGLIRERVFTTTFGAGDTFDAFVAAFRLPDLIFNLVVVGALSAAFIPLFTEKLVHSKDKKKREAFDFSLSVLHLVLIVVIIFSILYVMLADKIVPLITPGFSGGKLAMTIMLSRVMALQPILLSISFIFSGVLNSFKRFVAYAMAPILYNVGIIIGVVWLVPMMGVSGLGWGVVLGAALHMLVQLPSAIAVGWRWRLIMEWSSVDVKKLRRMIIPRIFGLAGTQVNLFLVTIIGSGLAAGTISVFHLASNVQSLPIGVFGLAFAQAAFPTLAEQVARGQEKEFRNTLTKTFRYILFLVVPVAVFFFLLRAQLIRVLFGDGAFDWEDTILTFETLGLLLISLFAQATVPLLTRAFYVRQNTIIPVTVSLISIVVNVALAIWLAPRMGVQGLALAFSVAAILNLVMLLGVLHWQLNGFNDREVLFSLARITVAAVLAGMVLQALKYPVAAMVDMTRFWGVLLQLLVSFGGGVAAYVAMCLLFRCDELAAIRKYLPRRAKIEAGTETPRFGGMLE
ncbi:MAG: murein biosynthesis integral membrane protein MurJ [Candidatus Andersenbacteria bacterium]|nr:murein biosynthesis integral membrane protein MurJ [bacterium]MDZ4225365.1 murein biosynthesis integral membrane protein MurJ [Candidatus Andersenbacteria bacterium]